MRLRNIIFYLLTIGACGAAMYIIALRGDALELDVMGHLPAPPGSGLWSQFKDTFHHNLTHPLAILLLQIITIIVMARMLGFICQKVGLPTVIGEIAAGIILGPSFLATQFPAYSAFLFPPASLGNLQFLSQIGLILFMFVIGMELNLSVLKDRAQDALIVSHASIALPFTAGMGLAYLLYAKFAPPGVAFLGFALFLGVSMSIAAFPVLARIVQERGLSKSRFGSTAITFAAVDDVTAWCLLAVVIAIVKAGSIISSLYTVLMALAYLLLMFRVVRPFLKKLGDVFADRESLSKPIVAVFFMVLLFSAYATEVIGIHALYGAFVAGVIMPPNLRFRTIFIDKVEDVAVVLLLPLFFVYTGLRTEIGLLNNVGLWKWTGLILATAVFTKFSGSALAARYIGMNVRESLMVGALMNTRGLMELVVLNIGYDLGVIGPEIFAMMVIMALVTTFMTGPTLDLIDRFFPARNAAPTFSEETEARRFKVLVPFGDPERGRNMVRVANAFIRRNDNAGVVALHLSPSSELNQFNVAERERDSFRPIRHQAKRDAMRIEMLFKPSNDIDKDVVAAINSGVFDMAIVGIGRSIYEGTLLGRLVGLTNRIINPERLIDTLTGREKLFEQTEFDDRVRMIVREARVPIGIYVEKGFEKLDRVVVPLFALGDSPLLTFAQKLVHNNGTSITFVDLAGVFEQSPEMLAVVRGMEAAAPDHVRLISQVDLNEAALKDQDLMLIGLDSWRRSVEKESPWLGSAPSMLIMRP
jgi:Kef-type K+ transport system membrane component KefB